MTQDTFVTRFNEALKAKDKDPHLNVVELRRIEQGSARPRRARLQRIENVLNAVLVEAKQAEAV
jgi:ribosome-binding protein aMBF1 (putative translation factor)